MDAIREQLRKPLVMGIAAFILGLIIGLVVLGWWLWPVEWTDAAPEDLRPDAQVDYLRMVIDSYALRQNAAEAQVRYAALGEDGPEALAAIQTNPAPLTPDAIAAFSAAVQAGPLPPLAETAPAVGTPEAGVIPEEEPAERSVLGWVLPVMCIVTLLLLAALGAVLLMRGRVRLGGRGQEQAMEGTEEAIMTDYTAAGEEPPIGQFMASYKLGDDLFDDSFSIDSPSGEFLGECGVGISETIGVGEPKKVTAFEVWLFDKNDIQTVTKVLMSEHAFADDVVRQRLAAKGEPVEASTGTQVVLETASLQLVARVVDMNYGEGALPDGSFFDSLILELAVWQK